MIKVTHKDLESITKFLDNLSKRKDFSEENLIKESKKAEKLSKMIKDSYTDIKPDYDDTEEKLECPKCGNCENLHYNYDYSKSNLPIEDVLCNECGEFFKIDQYE